MSIEVSINLIYFDNGFINVQNLKSNPVGIDHLAIYTCRGCGRGLKFE